MSPRKRKRHPQTRPQPQRAREPQSTPVPVPAPSHNPWSRPASEEHPYDVLSARLDQCGAILCAVENCFDDEQGRHVLSGPQLRATLSGVYDMLLEARQMADTVGRTRHIIAAYLDIPQTKTRR